jgi:hypothetical protein
MIGNSVCLRVKRGKPGNYSADWLYEREGETELQIPKKMSDREPLSISKNWESPISDSLLGRHPRLEG